MHKTYNIKLAVSSPMQVASLGTKNGRGYWTVTVERHVNHAGSQNFLASEGCQKIMVNRKPALYIEEEGFRTPYTNQLLLSITALLSLMYLEK